MESPTPAKNAAGKCKTDDQIRETRAETLYASWIKVQEHFEAYALVSNLNTVRVGKVIEDYAMSRENFVNRHKITGRIQKHKVAGLMAAAILKSKPVDVNDRDHSPYYEATQGNEVLAFWHGLAICAEGAESKEIEALVGHPLFKTWQGDLMSLFEHHPDNPECFALIFETISLPYFPDNLKREPA